MPSNQTRNVSLTAELNALIGLLVSSGHYQNASEVVRAGLRLLAQQADREALLDSSPRVAHGTLAGIAAGYIGKLALEAGGGGPPVATFHFGGGGRELASRAVRAPHKVQPPGLRRLRTDQHPP